MTDEAVEIENIAMASGMSELEAAIYLGLINNGFAMDQGDAADGARNIASYVLKHLPDDTLKDVGLAPEAAQVAGPAPELVMSSIVQDKVRTQQMFWKTAWYFHECGFSGRSLVDALRETATQLEAAFGLGEMKGHE